MSDSTLGSNQSVKPDHHAPPPPPPAHLFDTRNLICQECGTEYRATYKITFKDVFEVLCGVGVVLIGRRILLDSRGIHPLLAIPIVLIALPFLCLGIYTVWRALWLNKRCSYCGSNHHVARFSPPGEELSKEWEERKSANKHSD
jgi:hypothetical protein